MGTLDPKTQATQPATGKAGAQGAPRRQDEQQKKDQVPDQGIPNNANTQTGTAQSGYDEKNPKQPGGQQQLQPKVTNQENDITNSEEQYKWEEDQEPVQEQSGNAGKDPGVEKTDPSMDSPLPDEEGTDKKIPL